MSRDERPDTLSLLRANARDVCFDCILSLPRSLPTLLSVNPNRIRGPSL